MADIETQIEELTRQLADLRMRQSQMDEEMALIENQLESLRETTIPNRQRNAITTNISNAIGSSAATSMPYAQQPQQNIQKKSLPKRSSFKINKEMEDFIGTNVISKIGILVTIIGVFIGAKYAIDNELISPLMRIISGYAVSFALSFVALKLKSKYSYFSSVLIAGALSVAYFITYIAFSFYGLFPMSIAFALMIVTTAAAVGTALLYNQKVIALIGQVAAYAIPFLLGNKSGNAFGLFAYISLINIGLLILSFKKDWKVLYHIAFFLTWSVYVFWLLNGTQVTKNFSAALIFLTINFFTFYVTFLSYKIFRKEQYQLGEIAILLLNALFYFFLGTFLIDKTFQNIHLLTWFTVANAVVHFIAGYCIFRLKLADLTVYQFALGLGILFITIAIPIGLNGSWVTLLWTVEATTLFYIAVANQRNVYLTIALPLVIIAVLSLLQDWSNNYSYINGLNRMAGFQVTPFANLNFLLSLFVCACLGFISFTSGKIHPGVKSDATIFFKTIVPGVFILLLYFAFFNEIHLVWDKMIQSKPERGGLVDRLFNFQSLSLIMFSCLYITAWFFINMAWLKNEVFHYVLLCSGALATIVFLTKGLYLLGELRENYLSKLPAVNLGAILLMRYLSFATLAVMWAGASRSLKASKPVYPVQVAFSSLFNLTLLTVISNEFIQWMDFSGYQNQYKLGLSLICGAYALALIFAGIIKNKKHLRISAMVLFSVTLLKLFFYDLASLSTISKTIVLVLLGILLLFASFLYNKYKDLLSGKEGS